MIAICTIVESKKFTMRTRTRVRNVYRGDIAMRDACCRCMNYAPVRVCMNSYTYESFNDIQTHNARPQLTFWNLCFMYFHRSLPRSFAISYRQLFICFFFRTFENRQVELLNADEDKKKIKNKTKIF